MHSFQSSSRTNFPASFPSSCYKKKNDKIFGIILLKIDVKEILVYFIYPSSKFGKLVYYGGSGPRAACTTMAGYIER